MRDAVSILAEHRGSVVVVDTNILILLIVGRTDRKLIGKFKRLQQFDEADFDLLCKVLMVFSSIVTTPNILTETSNLCGQLGEADKRAVYQRLATEIVSLDERYIISRDAAENHNFAALGLTDVGLALLASEGVVVLTDDRRAAGTLAKSDAKVINFNHLRNYE